MNQNVNCPNCGGLIKDDKRFCGFCGAKLPEQESNLQQLPQQQQQQQTVIIQQPQQPQFVTITPKVETNNLAVASLVFAILGLIIIPGLGGLLATILGFIGAFNPVKRVMAIVSAIIGLFSMIGYSIFLWWLLLAPWYY